MDSLIEVFIFLGLSLFFTVFYEMDTKEHTWGAFFSGLCWIFTGLVYLVWDREVPTFALFFGILGIFYFVRGMVEVVSMHSLGRRLDGDSD